MKRIARERTSSPREFRAFFGKKLRKMTDIDILERVISKIDDSDEKLLKGQLPFLSDKEYDDLISFQKQKRRRAK